MFDRTNCRGSSFLTAFLVVRCSRWNSITDSQRPSSYLWADLSSGDWAGR
jgi:hypothetical protein